MAIRPLVELAVLGFLNEWNQSSIDTIHERLEHNFGPFWTFGYGSLVPAVSDLEEKGHVELVIDGEDSFPESKAEYPYAITDAGRERLRELLSEPLTDVEDPKQRYQVIIKLGFIHHLPAEAQVEEFDRLIERFATLRNDWEEIRDHHDAETMAEFDDHGYRIELIELSIQMIDTLINWLERHRSTALEKAQ